jgi:MFS family permease
MKPTSDFLKITFSDFVVRSAYQMGKTPLLPIFAATLGASGAFLGFIVSVSTLTGLMTKPLFGIFSDRWGRRVWLLISTAFFVGMPFVYRFIQTPEQLALIRIIHGTATAIYGPVTLAYITEIMPDHVAESLGWFGIARSGGYIIGPALAGWLLLTFEPVAVFTAIGLISTLAIIPTLTLMETHADTPLKRDTLGSQLMLSVRESVRTPAIWLSGILEAMTFIALYTVKAFLPVYALDAGINVALVGLFFSVQEGVHVIAKPIGGRMGDRHGHRAMIAVGMVILALGLVALPYTTGLALFVPSVLTGLAQALIFPATVALVSRQIPQQNIGAGMGFIGMWQNFGKVVGPVLGGLLIARMGFAPVLILLSALLFIGACLLPFILPRGSSDLHDEHALRRESVSANLPD